MQKENQRRKAIFALFVAAFLFSSGGLGIKQIHAPTSVVLGWRAFWAFLTLAILSYRKGHEGQQIKKETVFSALVYVWVAGTFVAATQRGSAAQAIFLQYSGLAYVGPIARIWLGERMHYTDWLSVFLAIAGVFILSQGAMDQSRDAFVLGVLSSIGFAFFPVAVRAAERKSEHQGVFPSLIGNLILFVFMFPMMLSYRLPWHEHVILCLLGVGQIGLGYAFFHYGASRLRSLEVALVGALEPLLNPLWVWLFLGEIPNQAFYFAAIFLLMSVGFSTFRALKEMKTML